MSHTIGKSRILLFEQDEVVAERLKSCLGSLGWNVCGNTTSASEALEAAGLYHPDAALADIGLDGETGVIKAAEMMRNEMGIPVVLVAANEDAALPKHITLTFPFFKVPADFQGLDTMLHLALHAARADLAARKAEEALRQSEERSRSLFNSTNDGVCLHEVLYSNDRPIDYRILDINPRYELITGLSRNEAVGTMASVLYGAGEPPYLEEYAKVVETGEPMTFETYFEPMDKHFLISVYSVGPHRFATVFQDITSHKKAEATLKEREEQFRLTYYTTPDAVNINRLEDGLYVDINDGFTRITGYTREDVIGRTSFEIGIWHSKQDREQLVRELREKSFCDMLEAKFRMKDGHLMTGRMSARIINFKGVPHIISITRDISRLKEVEQQKEQLIARLQTALSEVKTLRGFVPICASCKKIRDDQGYWEQVEKYVSDRTEARFSHGICPDCARKLYPDIADKLLREKECN